MKRVGISLFRRGQGRNLGSELNADPPGNRTSISRCHLSVGSSESNPTKVPKTAAYGIGNARFVIKAFFVAEVHFADTGTPSGTVPTIKCYCLMFSTLRGRTRDIYP